jgi:heptosyltransferase-2
VVDKSLKAVGVIKRTTVDQVYGFKVHPANGAIIPASPAAEELWSLGLDNNKKFFVNKKPETQLMIEALELGEFQRDEYWLPLTQSEKSEALSRKKLWQDDARGIIGLNTGCSNVIAYKKLTVEMHRDLIRQIQTDLPNYKIVLLGGPEDTERNQRISYGLDVINSATESGLRDGLVSIAACDIVVTGDSLGMHMAISQRKEVVAWFGATCEQEIDLYDRGFKVLSKSACSPCWKRTCEKSVMCYDQVSLKELMDAIKSCCTNGLSGGLAPLDTASQKNERSVATT